MMVSGQSRMGGAFSGSHYSIGRKLHQWLTLRSHQPNRRQAYLVGHDGWGTYAVSDGCLQRLRYTGSSYPHPFVFMKMESGCHLWKESMRSQLKTLKLFSQAMNYKYSNAYGSPEFSVKYPLATGTWCFNCKILHLLEEVKPLFVEILISIPRWPFIFWQIERMHSQTLNCHFHDRSVFRESVYHFPGYQGSNPRVKQEELSLPIMIVGLKDKKIQRSAKNQLLLKRRWMTHWSLSSMSQTWNGSTILKLEIAWSSLNKHSICGWHGSQCINHK